MSNLVQDMSEAWNTRYTGSESKGERMLCVIGRRMRETYGNLEAAAADTPLWDAFKAVHIASGKKWSSSIKARLLKRWAFPGHMAVDDGRFYKLADDGITVVYDRERSESALSSEQRKACQDISLAWARADTLVGQAETLQEAAGLIICKVFANAPAAADCKPFWEELWRIYEASIGRVLTSAQRGTRKARALYQYGFPGQGKSSGNYYMRLENGSCVKDHARMAAEEPSVDLAPDLETRLAESESLRVAAEARVAALETRLATAEAKLAQIAGIVSQ
jgi:hypothetical protein